MNSGVAGNILLPSFPRKRESSNLTSGGTVDYSLRLPFGPPYGRSTRVALLSRLRGNDGFIHTSLWKQRGAGTLMATVFLLLVVALLGGIGLRMAGTDINDTAVQNDSVEALFLAESGLERAIQRLAAGTLCTALAPDTAQTLGRGDFQIQSSSIVGSLCRVTVLGRVLLNGAMSAQRQIEGDLSVSSGGWAVGLNRTIVYWNGSAWSNITGAANGTPAGRDLFAVYCVSVSDCWAVGENGTIVRGNGSSWTTAGFTNGAPNDEDLLGVHCPDSSTCWAVGENGTIVRWNGTSWTNITGAANGAPDDRDLNAVYCLSPTSCWAVGDRDSGNGLIVRLVGSNWRTSGFTNSTPNAHLYGVACTAADNCWAVGNSFGSNDVIAHWNGSNWSRITYGGVPNVRLNAIHCLSGTACWAVGNTSSSHGTIVFGNGSTWTAAGITNNSPNEVLNAVHCSPGGDCWAVGVDGAAARLSGTTWSMVAMPTTRDLHGVSFPSGSGGSGNGLRVWREIIPFP